MEDNSTVPNLFVVDTSGAGWRRRNHPFYIITRLRLLEFNPHTDKCLVSTKDLTIKIYRNIEKKSCIEKNSCVHGKWICRRFTENLYGVECPICHTTWDSPTKYCPNCGEDMYGKT